ncbi:MAG: hypothetical protein LBU64_06495 [Planctomycetota bacterium]|jgi:hypothetical protein|nr:hypothetical protein [Planctomycetota bacterium]
MAEMAVLLGLREQVVPELSERLANMGLEPVLADWAGFDPRSWRGCRRPALLFIDVDNPRAWPIEKVGFRIRRHWGGNCPLIAMTSERKFARLELILAAGADDCLPASGPASLWESKIARRLAENRPPAALELTEEIPIGLARLFAGEGDIIRLEDLAAIHPGVSPRRNFYRRLAPPDSEWRGVLTAETVDRFLVGKPVSFLSWNRLHLFRLPAPAEYDVEEKVLLRRAGPPLSAAVDRSRLPAGVDLYSLIPKPGIGAGFIACLLNSRLLDFYFNRLAPNLSAGRLRLEEVKKIPVPRPTARGLEELNRAAAFLAHFGPRPQGWLDRQNREEIWNRMEDAVFELYGAVPELREELAGLHF